LRTTQTTLATRVRTALRGNEAGYTVLETIVAASITMMLSLAIVSIVFSSLEVIGKSQINAIEGAKSEAVLTSFANIARDADQLKAASSTTLIFHYRTQNRCERHSYQFVSDPANSGRLRLTHTILALQLPGSLPCSSVDPSLSSGQLSPQTTRTELANLGPQSGFTYYANTGQRAPQLGDEGFNPASGIPLCRVGSVAIALETVNLAGTMSASQLDRTQVAFRNNARGLTC
jgi:hypothetical protein